MRKTIRINLRYFLCLILNLFFDTVKYKEDWEKSKVILKMDLLPFKFFLIYHTKILVVTSSFSEI